MSVTMTYQPALDAAIQAAREAGALLRDDFHRSGGPRGAGSHADADAEADALIRARLVPVAPWGYRSEEVAPHGHASEGHLWLVDPNDGTSAYLRGHRGSAVSIALLREGVLVLGVVYAFAYPDDDGDLVAWAEGCGPLTRNGYPVTGDLTAHDLAPGEIVLVSQGADDASEANAALVHPARYRAIPSIAYRLALVAAGDGIAAVSLNGPGGWDYAAGHALVRACGGVLLDQQGAAVSYDLDGRSSTSYCFGGAPKAVATLQPRSWSTVLGHGKMASPLVRLQPGRAITDAGRLTRAQGCLLGQLAGDSLGSLVEFQDPDTIASRYPGGLRRLADGGTWNTLAGQPTDDSELALALARSIIAVGDHDTQAARVAYQRWMHSGPFDSGHTTRAALMGATSATLDEHLTRVAAENGASKANGSLMRVSALGIAGAGDPSTAAAWARRDSALTHPNGTCAAACAAYVAAIAVLVDGGKAEHAIGAARAAAGSDGDVLEALERARATRPKSYTTQQGFVITALQNAFFQLLHATSLEEGVVDTVMQGGDTDTNGAIAGALLGARFGRAAIPAQWLDSILGCRALDTVGAKHPRPKEYWGVDALELAERLLLLGSSKAAVSTWPVAPMPESQAASAATGARSADDFERATPAMRELFARACALCVVDERFSGPDFAERGASFRVQGPSGAKHALFRLELAGSPGMSRSAGDTFWFSLDAAVKCLPASSAKALEGLLIGRSQGGRSQLHVPASALSGATTDELFTYLGATDHT